MGELWNSGVGDQTNSEFRGREFVMKTPALGASFLGIWNCNAKKLGMWYWVPKKEIGGTGSESFALHPLPYCLME